MAVRPARQAGLGPRTDTDEEPDTDGKPDTDPKTDTDPERDTDPETDTDAKVVLRLFAAARQAAGTGRAEAVGATVGEVLDRARAEFGAGFGSVLDASRVWRNGEPTDRDTRLADGDEVAVLPPVSGGACAPRGLL